VAATATTLLRTRQLRETMLRSLAPAACRVAAAMSARQPVLLPASASALASSSSSSPSPAAASGSAAAGGAIVYDPLQSPLRQRYLASTNKAVYERDYLARLERRRSAAAEQAARTGREHVNMPLPSAASQDEWLYTRCDRRLASMAAHHGVFEHVFGRTVFPRINVRNEFAPNVAFVHGNEVKPADVRAGARERPERR
jgi:hypothetical protein